jgi:type I restriction enzyme S subunit
MSWPTVKIESIRAKRSHSLVGGPFGSELTTKDYVEQGIPVIRGSNLPDEQSFRDEGFVFVTEQKANLLRANNAFAGDLVFTQRGTLGQVGIIPLDSKYPRYLLSQSQMKLAVDEERADARFVYYFFRCPDTVQRVKNLALTSGVPHINLGILRDFDVPLPPLQAQKRIIDSLTTYDELIAKNCRRMKLLEEAARLLYQEWFVRLKFPGHEHIPVINGVPHGWERLPIREWGEVVTGKTPSTRIDGHFGGDVPFIKIPDMARAAIVVKTQTTLAESGALTQTGKFVPAGTLLVSCIGTLGVVAITSTKSQFNQQINALLPYKTIYRYYCFFAFKGLKSKLEAMGGGATMGNVNKKKFETINMVRPSEIMLEQFHGFCEPLFEQIRILLRENENLQTARDLLLPRLMSGEIAV